ncbi:hypothetical protein V9N52_004063 [Vibrio navarrensis]
MTIAIAHNKGGVGKTTLSLQARELRLSKTHQSIEHGMMQELLMGKTRLVQPLNKELQYG